jgi:transcriptional regulator with XRE-family HTH domain
MTGLYRTGKRAAPPESLGAQLRRLREAAGAPGWKTAAAAEMDAAKLSKIECGKFLPTQEQLAALARFFKTDLAPLEMRRIAEDMKRRYGGNPNFEAAAAIVQEEAGEYRVNNHPPAVSKSTRPVNNRKKQK